MSVQRKPSPDDLLTARQAPLARGEKRAILIDPRTAERREGYYIGTDRPHTDEWGNPLAPWGGWLNSPAVSNRGDRAYFIQHEDGGPIKIGVSWKPDDRLRQININTHDPRYRLLATLPGGRTTEVELHVRFRRIRVHGEWFLPEPELLDYIAGIPDA